MASKEIKATLLTFGTVFVSAATALATSGLYWQAVALGAIGIAAFYVRERIKEEPVQ